MIPLDKIPVQFLKNCGTVLAEKLAIIGINTLQDILFNFPLRYQNRTYITNIKSLVIGVPSLIEGVIVFVKNIHTRLRSRLLVLLKDSNDCCTTITLHFYINNKNKRYIQNIKCGVQMRCYGKVVMGDSGLEIYNPEYCIINNDKQMFLEKTLTPIYKLCYGLTQEKFRNSSKQVLKIVNKNNLIDFIPDKLAFKYGLIPLHQALSYIHRPQVNTYDNIKNTYENINIARYRLVFEELLSHQLLLKKLRNKITSKKSFKLKPKPHEDMAPRFLKNLGFILTSAQKNVNYEITYDLSQSTPMLRLIQGDVGSGKTVIAALAAIKALSCGYQVALMVPTEILAEQHFINFTKWFSQFSFDVILLTSKIKGKSRIAIINKIMSGIPMVIGTHSLFQELVEFKNLALVIIDEQHRFGVKQRIALRNKGINHQFFPHQLMITATPIPRTMSMSYYSYLNTSIINEIPKNRNKVITVLINESRREEVIKRVMIACNKGNQAYWVCPRIEDKTQYEKLHYIPAETTFKELKSKCPCLNIGLIHGRMKSAEKINVISDFKKGNVQLLVATTIIETGLDIPNASIIIIENAEMLGLVQLHQLRGRVGRSSIKSYCVLMYNNKLSTLAKTRLKIIRKTCDGFVIAEKDLELRGPGEILGINQKGFSKFRIANLITDAEMLPDVMNATNELINMVPENINPILDRWINKDYSTNIVDRYYI